MVLLQLFVKKIKFCVIFRHFPRIYYRSVFMLLNILHREGKFKLNEKKNSSKHAGRYNPEEKSRELIRNVNKICELRGISHYTLAKKADISTSTLHSLLSGKSRPYMYTVYRLCNALDIPISDLLTEPETEKMETLSKEEQELLMLYRRCSESKKHLLEIYMQMLSQFEEKRIF